MNIKNRISLAAALLAIAVLAALIIVTPRPLPEEPLPNPNGYDDFVKAAPLVSLHTSGWSDLSVEELRALVATNQPALELVRVGLTKECRMAPWEVSATNGAHLNDLSASKGVAHAFAAASRLALIEGRTNDAAMLALDCIRYGNESTRGGVIIDYLVGIAINAIGLRQLEASLPGADAETLRGIVATLDDVSSRSESVATVFKRESQWARRGRLGPASFVARLLLPFQTRKMRASLEQKVVKGGTDLQRARLHAAARAYELDHGQPPTEVRDLVPNYLKSIPLDPVTGQELN